MGKIEDSVHKMRKDTFGVDKLQIETEPKEFTLDLTTNESDKQTTPNYYRKLMQGIKAKYKMTGLQCDGLLGYRLENSLEQETLENLSRETARANVAGFYLATAKVTFQNKPVRLFYEVKL
jgi:hypothetical protein